MFDVQGRQTCMSTAADLAASGYRLGPVVGAGGGGQVYRAWTSDGIDVAVKVAHADDDVAAARTAREVAIARRLPRASFPAIDGHGRLDDGRAWIAMEWIEGGTLGQRLTATPWAAAEVIAIGLPLACALAAAHAAGVIHRDVKPDNVMFRRDGSCVLVDLGLARGIDEPGTSTTRCAGTPSYMAPEQVLGEVIEPRTDLYGLGGILYRLLAGHDPFGGGALEIQLAHLGQEPPPLPAPASARDAALHALVTQLLAKRPCDRPASAAVVADRLARMAPGRRLARIARASSATALVAMLVAGATAVASAGPGAGSIAEATPVPAVGAPAVAAPVTDPIATPPIGDPAATPPIASAPDLAPPPIASGPDAGLPWATVSAGDYTLRARWPAAPRAGDRLAVTIEVWGDDDQALPEAALAATVRDPSGHTIALGGAALRSLVLAAPRPGAYLLTVFAPDGDITLAVPIEVGAAPSS